MARAPGPLQRFGHQNFHALKKALTAVVVHRPAAFCHIRAKRAATLRGVAAGRREHARS
jgi:hypothetical protein